MIRRDHLDAYLKAMAARDVISATAHMANDVVIYSPLVPAPIKGKENVANVLAALLSTIDSFEPKLLLRENADFVAVFIIRFGDHLLDGMDHMHINEAGLVDSMTVAWRPLPSVVAVQQKLAPKLGGRAMKLMNAD